MRTVLYARVSSEEQAEQQTIQTQLEHYERYCAYQQIAPGEVFADDGVRGTLSLDERPAGRRLLATAVRGLTVCVYRLDRLGRDPRVTLNAIHALEERGCRILSMTELFDSETPGGRLMITMLAGFGGYEREVLIGRTMDGSDRHARAGVWLGGVAPFGYRVEGQGKAARITPAEEPLPGCAETAAEVVGRIYHLLARGRETCYRIAALLNEEGVPSPRNVEPSSGRRPSDGLWTATTVWRLVRNPVYKGEHVYGRTRRCAGREPIPRPVPALVDADLWARAQEQLARNSRRPKTARREYLLSGLLTCALCGQAYIGMTPIRRGKPYPYYQCGGKDRDRGEKGTCCPSRLLRCEPLEAWVWSLADAFFRDPGTALEHHQPAPGRDPDLEPRRLESRLAEKAVERERLARLYRRGKLDDATYDHQVDEVEREERELRRRLGECATIPDTATVAAALAQAATLWREWLATDADFAARRRLVERLVRGVRIETTNTSAPGRERSVCVRAVLAVAAGEATWDWECQARLTASGWESF